MKHQNSLAILAVTLTLPLAAQVAALADDVGVVATAQNDVSLRLPNQTKARRIGAMQGFPVDSRVQVGANGRAIVVFYSNGARYSLAPGSVVTIGADSVKTESGPAAKSLPALKLQQAKILQSSRIAYGRPGAVLVRGDKHLIELNSLLCGSTTESRPVFSWTAVPGAVAYKVTVSDDDDKNVLERESPTASLAYPTDIPALKPGANYIWVVRTHLGDEEYEAQGTFTVLSNEDKAALQAELDALKKDADQEGSDPVLNAVLEAEIYRKYDVVDEAVDTYEKLVKDNPDSLDFHQALKKLYAEQNRAESSKAEGEIVDKLLAAD